MTDRRRKISICICMTVMHSCRFYDSVQTVILALTTRCDNGLLHRFASFLINGADQSCPSDLITSWINAVW